MTSDLDLPLSPQTERPVKEARLGPAVTVETRFTRLPESFTALMLFAVKYSHGPPVAYVRAAAFNELDIRLNGGPGQCAAGQQRSGVIGMWLP